ncbi:MAG: hypothetical protein MZV63_63055 [Marinilabiliales bacterium]|nr:hypothetical protein [Marinilabiliales bacterium]
MWRNSGSLTGKGPDEGDVLDRVAAGVPALLQEEDLAEILLGPHPGLPAGRRLAGTTKTSSVRGAFRRGARMGWGPSMFSSGLRNSRAKRTSSRGEAPSRVKIFSMLIAVVIGRHADRDRRPVALDDLGVVDLVGLDRGLAEEVLEAPVGIEAALAEGTPVRATPSPARA